jgi:predicted acyl esterase
MTNRYTRLGLLPQGGLGPAPGSGTSTLRYGPPSQSGTVVTYTSAPFRQGATLAGPTAVQIAVRSTTSNVELMADLYDVAPDGTATQVTHGGLLGSLRELDRARSWRDARGLPTRPFLALQRDVPVPVGETVVYAIPLQPTVWSLAPGHRLRLRLSTQADAQVCLQKLAQVEAPSLGCAPRPSALAALAGGSYTLVQRGSFLSLPLLRYHALRAVRSGTTPTSGGVALPLDW